MSWLTSKDFNDAAKNAIPFWEKLKNDQKEGKFWADEIKKYREDPTKRLSIAIENLPLPAAFREAAIAIRLLIKEKRKINHSFNNELTMLYWMAAIYSFQIPYSDYLQQPGFNVMEAIPGAVINSLDFSYFEVGYMELELLNKQDVNMLVKEWGEPNVHSTLNKKYSSLWHEYAKKVKEKQEKRLEELKTKTTIVQSLQQPPSYKIVSEDTEESYQKYLAFLISRTKSRGNGKYFNKFVNRCRVEAAEMYPKGAAKAQKKDMAVGGFLGALAAIFSFLG